MVNYSYLKGLEPDYIRYDGDDDACYLLEKEGQRPLVVIGPHPVKSDLRMPDRNTYRLLKALGDANHHLLSDLKYDSWAILNVHPLRAEEFEPIDYSLKNHALLQENICYIANYLVSRDISAVLLSWGENEADTEMLNDARKQIQNLLNELGIEQYACSRNSSGEPISLFYAGNQAIQNAIIDMAADV